MKSAVKSKPAIKSKTYWFALLTFLVSLGGLLQGQEWMQQYPAAVSVIGMVVGVVTFLLRFVTHERVGLFGRQ